MSIFKKIGKAIGKVARKTIVGTIARTVVGSVPVLGGVVSAVGAVKSSLHPPTLANTANLSARTGAPAFGHPGAMHDFRRVARPRPPGSRRKRAPAYGPPGEYHPRRKRAARRKGVSSGGSAKQRAARARFAAAAKRGRIKKGSHL